jgi:hypothetical protein
MDGWTFLDKKSRVYVISGYATGSTLRAKRGTRRRPHAERAALLTAS